MKLFCCFLSLLLLAACWNKNETISLAGEAGFRISYNPNHRLTDAEVDSIDSIGPTYSHMDADDKLYTILIKNGIVVNERLDTSGLGLQPLNPETPPIHFAGMDISLKWDAGYDTIVIKKGSTSFKLPLGESKLGGRWVCPFDSNDDGQSEVLLLETYYFMGGYNFDLKHYSF